MDTFTNERSPVRLLDEAFPEGLGEGGFGLIVGRAGTGKTACLVHFALDRLMNGSSVLHIGLDEPVGRIRGVYEEVFSDMRREGTFEDAQSLLIDIERKRHIHSYLGHSFTMEKLREAIRFLREHMHFSPQVLVLDGVKLEGMEVSTLESLLALASELNAELWATGTVHREDLTEGGLPEVAEPFRRHLTALVELRGGDKGLHFALHTPSRREEHDSINAILDSGTMQVLHKD